jgi:hypothetical protein
MKNNVTWLACIVVTVGLVGIWIYSSKSTGPYGEGLKDTGNPSPNNIFMFYTSFSPPSLIVPRGTTVTWKNDDVVTHGPTSNIGVWDVGDILPGGSKSITFSSAGTFRYHCSTHPIMAGTIVVQ